MILVKIPLLTGRGLFRQRWYIYYSNGSGRYHFVNKAYRTKLLEQSYDAVDREVTLGSNYDNCCWELERDPDDQDPEVLTYQDWCIVSSLKRFLVSQVAESDMDSRNAILRAIEQIRKQTKYKGKYDFSDANGFYKNKYHYINEDITIKVRVTSNQASALVYSGTIANWGLVGASVITEWPYSAIWTFMGWALFPPDDVDLILGALSMLPDYGVYFSVISGLKTQFNIETEENKITNDDYVTTITLYNSNDGLEGAENIYSPSRIMKYEKLYAYAGDDGAPGNAYDDMYDLRINNEIKINY